MRLGSYLGQLLFRKSYFFGGGNLSRIKISTEEPLFGSRHLCTASTFQKSYFFKRGTFTEQQLFKRSNIPDHLTFTGKLLFQIGYFYTT